MCVTTIVLGIQHYTYVYCLFSLFSVKLEGQDPSHVEILANVVERNIELLNPESNTQVQCIQFGAAYYGTDQMQSFLLCNNGPDKINFVVLLNEDTEGQEVVSMGLEKSSKKFISVFIKVVSSGFLDRT